MSAASVLTNQIPTHRKSKLARTHKEIKIVAHLIGSPKETDKRGIYAKAKKH